MNNYKEVYFDQYCKSCEYKEVPDNMLPCDECLGEFMNVDSHKPVLYKEKEKEK